MGSVQITLANGQLGGTLQTSDGVAGMLLTGVTEGTYAIGTPVLLTRFDDLATAGITATGNPFAYRQVQEFYKEAGNGAKLYLMLAPATMTVDMMADGTVDGSAKKLLDHASGKIKLLGIMTNDDAVATATSEPTEVTNAINEAVYTAAVNLAALASNYFADQKPFRAIIGGTSFNGAGDELRNISEGTTNNRTAIVVGDTVSGNAACLGLLLGRLSAIPVMRKISRVRTGAVATATAFLGTSTIEAAAPQMALIAENGFITWWTYPNVAGYFFSGDDTYSARTDDYHSLARGRVVDKAHIIAYTTFVQEVDDEVPVNEDGTLDAGFCKWLSGQIINQLNNTMTANREISSAQCLIDPTQNILSTNQLRVVLKIIPVGYATDIIISLGFTNPAV